jgi:hypothetical protein
VVQIEAQWYNPKTDAEANPTYCTSRGILTNHILFP